MKKCSRSQTKPRFSLPATSLPSNQVPLCSRLPQISTTSSSCCSLLFIYSFAARTASSIWLSIPSTASRLTSLSIQCLVVSLKPPFSLHLCCFILVRIGFDFSLFLSFGHLQIDFVWLLVS